MGGTRASLFLKEIDMKTRVWWGLVLVVWPLLVAAKSYRLEGKIGDKYPIVIELEETERGLFSGKYAYTSTLKRDGDVRCSWLTIKPASDAPYYQWVIRDCNGKVVENWYDVSFSDGKYLSARMTNSRGKTYDVAATVAGQSKANEPLDSYFRQHVGDYANEFNLFGNERVRTRLQKMMGAGNFKTFLDIFQVQVPIEYRKGMYWSSGFMPHQCCDPATIWAYDSSQNTFYVWIRKDDRDYWWSENGSISFNFRELVESEF